MNRRKLIGFCCFAALGLGAARAEGGPAAALNGSKKATAKCAKAAPASVPVPAGSMAQNGLPAPAYLVKEVVYNELHDHDTHGYWRYWIEKHSNQETQLRQQVETPAGPVTRLELTNGRPVGAGAREEDDERLRHLLSSPSEQAQHRKDYSEDEHRIGRILALLPDAFQYEQPILEGRSVAMPDCACYHMRFRPNPDYPARGIESRIFHAMTGELWIGVESKRLVRLEGRLQNDVDFGYGILGRLYKDGWFRLERTRVGAQGESGGDWKTQRLEIHMTGRAMLFKTISKETSEVRGGFLPVASGLTLQQAALLVWEPLNGPTAQSAALVTSR